MTMMIQQMYGNKVRRVTGVDIQEGLLIMLEKYE